MKTNYRIGKELKCIIKAILEKESQGQLCPQTIDELKGLLE